VVIKEKHIAEIFMIAAGIIFYKIVKVFNNTEW